MPTISSPPTTSPSASTGSAPGGHPGFAIFCLAIGAFGVGVGEFAAMGLLPRIAEDLDVSITQAGHAVTAYALGVVVGAPLITAVTAHMGRKLLLLSMAALFALGNVLVTVAPTLSALLAARFLTGLPHGVYLGVAGIVASHLVGPARQGTAVARVMLGLTVANIVGVPLATVLGTAVNWRVAFLLFAGIGLVNFVAMLAFVPRVQVGAGMSEGEAADGSAAPSRPSVRRELRALRRPQIILTLVAGSIGFGGMFAVYTFISPTVTTLADAPESVVPWVLVTYGVGMTTGSLIVGPLVDKSIERTCIIAVITIGVVLLAFGLFAGNIVVLFCCIFCMGIGGSLFTTSLQVRLMRDSHDAPSLAAAMNHAAFNLANALGAYLGGVVIDAGLGFRAPAFLGVGLTLLGFIVMLVAVLLYRRKRNKAREVLAL